jgi:CheY-like chemotaxis protein
MKKINCVLLIDDNPGDNYFNSIIIEEAAICENIKTANDGEQALLYLTKTAEVGQAELYPKPDMIFLDVNMPRMDGFEFLSRFEKLDENLKSKVIVMLTTLNDPEEKEKVLALGIVKEYITKPLDNEILRELITKYFSNN